MPPKRTGWNDPRGTRFRIGDQPPRQQTQAGRSRSMPPPSSPTSSHAPPDDPSTSTTHPTMNVGSSAQGDRQQTPESDEISDTRILRGLDEVIIMIRDVSHEMGGTDACVNKIMSEFITFERAFRRIMGETCQKLDEIKVCIISVEIKTSERKCED